MERNRVLDGWRGISISLVLFAHLFPVGPKAWSMNVAVAATGMVIFFVLSGFLITSILLMDDNIGSFIVRRFMRIFPLAWLVIAVTLILNNSSTTTWLRHLSFTANLPLPDTALTPATSHFWSLCVEIQFYVAIAFLVCLLRKRAIYLLPLFALIITANRIFASAYIDIHTLLNLDEILAGCILALIYHSRHKSVVGWLTRVHPLILLPLVILAAHPSGAWLNYLRPYLAMWMIGSTLMLQRDNAFQRMLNSRLLAYLAAVSYALYVFHGGLRETWLGSGETLERYVKRPLFLAATFALAHVSTFYYERHFIVWGKRLTNRPT